MTPLIAAHAFAALTALVLGGWQLFAAKGGGRHRVTGRVWVAAMLFVAVSSFWIKDLNPGQFSFLHVLSVVTIVTVSLGVWNARAGRIAAHRSNMIGSYLGLWGAFIAAVAIPARHVPTFVVTEPLGAAAAAVSIVATSALVIVFARPISDRASSVSHDGAYAG